MRRQGAAALRHAAGCLPPNFGLFRPAGRLQQVAPLAAASTSSNSGGSGAAPDRPTRQPAPQQGPASAAQDRKQHDQLLREMASNRKLQDLLAQPKLRWEMGIPEKKLQAVMSNQDNHGPAGLKAVRALMYTSPSPRTWQPSSEQPRSQQQRFAPAPPTGPPQMPAPAAAQPSGAGRQPEAAPSREPVPERPSIRDALNKQKIFPPRYSPGTYRIVCPKCKGGSKHELSFGVTIDEDSKSSVWNCFRASCGFTGTTHVERSSAVNESGFFVASTARKRRQEPPVRPVANLEPLTQEMQDFFAARGISEATLKRNGVAAETVYDPGERKESKVIAFPYFRDDTLVNIKYRTLDKRFWQVRGAEKVLYGLNDIMGAAEVVIVEGEMDKLALEEAGMRNVVSVPDGAPSRVRDGDLPPASEDTKYSYLWNCRAWLDQAVRIIIATDNDAPGDALAEELARRLGRERCWRVRWPLTRKDHEYALPVGSLSLEDDAAQEASQCESDGSTEAAADAATDAAVPMDEGVGQEDKEATASPSSPSLDERWYRKDANEVLLRDGSTSLRAFVEAAEPLPIRGLLRFHEYYDDIIKYYYLELRDGQGASTGWPCLDRLYKVVPGELTIVTGVPNSGKSEWIDALLCNLSEMHGWTFAMCSMEKRATDHARQLAEKHSGRPFFDLPYGRGMARMTFQQLDEALDWVDDRFHLIRYEDEQLPSVDWVLDIAKAAVYRYGIRGLVIDPYNELDHQRPSSMSETEYVSQMLTKVKRFAQTAGVHVWFVAHPRQLREWKGQAPNLYDISGSAHFINKADNGIVVHRMRDASGASLSGVEVLVRKVRNKAAGTVGETVLEYERINGRYVDSQDTNPPRTSQPVSMLPAKDRRAAPGAAPEAAGSKPSGFGAGLWLRPDGTVSNDPPGAG